TYRRRFSYQDVVVDDHLDRRVGLGEGAVDRLSEESRAVLAGDDDAHQSRLGHLSGSIAEPIRGRNGRATTAELDRPRCAIYPGRMPEDASVLFIMLDATRADRLSAWGNTHPTTPTLDGLAAAGALFRRHFANSHATRPSFPQLM